MKNSEQLLQKLHLLEKSLKIKWNMNLKIHDIDLLCPFCKKVSLGCSFCLCPSEICYNGAKSGFISQMIQRRGMRYNGCYKADLGYMRSLFEKYIRLTKKEIEYNHILNAKQERIVE